MASNGEESEFFYGIKNNASLANNTPTLIVTKDADGTYEHATIQDIPLSSAAIAALELKAPIASPIFTSTASVKAASPIFRFLNAVGTLIGFIQHDESTLLINSGTGAIELSATTTVNSSGDSENPSFFRVVDLTGSGDRNALITPNGTLTVGAPLPKVYNALLSQSGLNAPTAAIISNTLGGVPVWGYTSAGQYTLTLLGTFTSGKTLVFATIGANTAAGDTSIKCFLNTSTGEIILNTTFNAAFTNILLTNASFKIEVYP
jgi:hypothetical protein